ncbi:MAG: YvcK family protein [Clostridia bacterium]|nr:YvcK family protein [Clostridia bacterium]
MDEMKGILHWLRSSSKMKRWIFLILIGIVLTCYGISNILVQKEMDFYDVGKVVVTFVIGFTLIVIGLVLLNKRNMELFIEATDERMTHKKNVNMKSLIFDKRVYDRGPKVVVIGGGAGLNTVLTGMKRYTNNITAIVAVSEYGKKPTDSRIALKTTLPFEEVKDSIVSLSAHKKGELENLLNHEMANEKLRGLKFSDIYFTAMKEIHWNDTESISKSGEIFNIIGNILPVTSQEMKICAELDNGYVVEEKDRIPEIVTDKITKISRVYLKPSNCKPAEGVLEAIKEADSIIIGPGSLYTNVIPNLLVNGVAKAIKESKAMKIYVNNIMTESGQTDDYTVADHVNTIIEHCGEGIIDYCIYDTGEVIPEYIKRYNKEGADLVEQQIGGEKLKKIQFIKKNISTIIDGKIRHDPYLVAESAIGLICNDLKYQDKESDPEYVMLNAKLKSDKRINKLKKEKAKMDKKVSKHGIEPKEKNAKISRQSKFSEKYSDRIKSIKESEAKYKKNNTQKKK